MDFHDAYNFLQDHPMFNERFREALDVMVVRVNPETCCIDNDTEKNTKTEVWLEAGPYKDGIFYHDLELDCGGDTFEEAIIELAKLVKEHYPDKA